MVACCGALGGVVGVVLGLRWGFGVAVALLLAVGAAVTIAVWLYRRPWHAVVLVFAIAPLDDLQRFPQEVELSLVRLIIASVIPLWMARVLLRRERLRLPFEMFMLILLAVLFLAGTYFASAPRESVFVAASFVGYAMFGLLIVNEVTDDRRVETVARTYLIAAGVVGIIAILQFYTGSSLFPGLLGTEELRRGGLDAATMGAKRALGTSSNPNAGALVPVTAIPIGLGLLAGELLPKWRLLIGACVLTSAVHVALSFSRSAWLGLFVSAALLLVLPIRRRPGLILVAAIVIMLVVAALPQFPGPSALWLRLASAFESFGTSSRADVYEALPDFLSDHWMLGVGAGPNNFRAAMGEYHVDTTPHSAAIAVLAGGGLPALIIWATMFTAVFLRTLGARGYLPRDRWFLQVGLIVSLCAWQVHALFHAYLMWQIGWSTLALAVSCALIPAAESQNTRARREHTVGADKP